MTGFIKVNRKLLHTKLLQNPAMLQVWLYLNSQARFKKTEIDGIEVLPGQVLVCTSSVALACDLTLHKVRYAMECLEKQGLIRRENIRNRYSLITLLEPTEDNPTKTENMSVASENTAANPQKQTPTAALSDTDKQTLPSFAQNKPKMRFGTFNNILLTSEEKRLLSEHSTVCDSYIDNLSAYKQRTKKVYDDDFAVLCEWISKDDINEKRNAAKPAATELQNQKQQAKNAPLTANEKHALPDTASYDLAWAEAYAREHVPVLRKRQQK